MRISCVVLFHIVGDMLHYRFNSNFVLRMSDFVAVNELFHVENLYKW